MTAAALRRPRFSALFYTKRTGGKTETPCTVAADPETIWKRVADVTSGGPWSLSPQAVATYELFLTIHAISAENAAAGSPPAVTRGQVEHLLSSGGTSGSPEIDLLYEDGLITVDAVDGIVIVVPGPKPKALVKYPGWAGGDPCGLTRLNRAEREARIRELWARILADGLPIAVGDKHRAEFDEARTRGEVCLPWQSWAALLNTTMPAGRHPVTGKTAGNWVKAMLDAGDVIMRRKPRQVFDRGRWRTISGAYALARVRMASCAAAWREWREECRLRREERQAARAASPVTSAWRELALAWRFRDREAGWCA